MSDKAECLVCGYYGSAIYRFEPCPNEKQGRAEHLWSRNTVASFDPSLAHVDGFDVARYVYEDELPALRHADGS